MENTRRRSGIQMMAALIGLVAPLLHVMMLAVLLGVLGALCAVFLSVTAVYTLLAAAGLSDLPVLFSELPVIAPLIAMGVLALLRGIFHYAEQYCNHFIAFKILALLRSRIFEKLRALAPARLEGRERGNLISIITTDIELLEVFYAHTISPIWIALIFCGLMTCFISTYSIPAGLLSLAGYAVVGIWIPVRNGKEGGSCGLAFRNEFGSLNSFLLDSLRGMDEILQYGQGEKRKEELEKRTRHLSDQQEHLCRLEARQRSATDLTIWLFSAAMLGLTLLEYRSGKLGESGVLICTTAMLGSFGPAAALSGLSNFLNQTFASGERVLNLLAEEPETKEIPMGETGRVKQGKAFQGVQVQGLSFSYGNEQILEALSAQFRPGEITGIHGKSGSGKSTLLKLLMRFWDAREGEIRIDGQDIRSIPTVMLREAESYMTQETHLFHDSIANNIAIGRPGASRSEIEEAAKKAALHAFICSLPDGYDTQVGELGETLSGGERQRIGIARAFLHDAPLLLLDEPTSNLDILNEGMILEALAKEAGEKTVILVSHRASTLRIADAVIETGDPE